MNAFKHYIALAASGTPLTREEATAAFDIMMSGEATPSQIGGFLMALRTRGETIDEITGAVTTMRNKMTPAKAPADAIDIVGTGGDQSGSYNISTASAIVAAAAGATIAKHGNRGLSSKSGTADTLEVLGVNLGADVATIERCIEEVGLGFMFAPAHHSAMRHVGPTRSELGTRTIYNLLGPLSNPAGVKRQTTGVFAQQWVEPLAHALKDLGSDHVWILHGDGMDEITVTGPTTVAELKDGQVTTFEISPSDGGVSEHKMEAILGGDSHYNAAALTRLLDGEEGGYRDMVRLNAGAGLLVAGLADTLLRASEMAAGAIDSGKAKQTLAHLVEVSNSSAKVAKA
ncbi:anthranilate phosphoribosyltransferase [Pseudahrensia aquimaris]|uniref:Anthranilate phosphoribosyltransferase n=1 Tax=Pseudahrensia aquimaris TaxID=744461 RepID=A0ABW3FL07_9HYPH